jgi:hypothetical protein
VKRAAALLLALPLAACATTMPVRMYSADELAAVTRECRLALGDVAQFEEEPRLLFLLPVERAEQGICVSRWAQRRNLRLVYMENMERTADAAAD